MSYELRPITEAEWDRYNATVSIPFSERPTQAELDLRRGLFEFERSLAAFDGDEMVATAGIFSLELTLPGGRTLPTAGVSYIGVVPSHRRRGILRQMMARQFTDIAARGEALAILTASESGIYGRFGYGVATSAANFSIERQHAAFARPIEVPGQVRYLEHAQAMETMAALYERLRRGQPGAVNRSPARWAEYLSSPDAPVDGFGPRFYLVYEAADGEVRGATQYRVKHQWEDGLAQGVLRVHDVFAADAEAYAVLWRHLLSVDLVQTVSAYGRPVDEPLRWLLADPRWMRGSGPRDDLYVRLLDVPTALSARGYGATGCVTFEVGDAFRPETAGRYTLEAGPDGAECRRSEGEADLALDVADLGAAYLGGVSFATLARAGRVREVRAGALERADALFHVEPAPYCGTPF